MKFKTFLSCVFILSLTFAFGQDKKALIRQIDSLIHLKQPRPFNGVVLLTKNGKILYEKTQGFKNTDSKKPIEPDNQFEIMSNTKQITAVLLLKEVEKGKVDLQSPIKKYLPDLTQLWADSVTVHQLLNHTHGIVDTGKPLVFKPGTDYKYGNLSNNLLGRIIENVSQKTYRELAESLFQSLKMKNTFCYSENKKSRLVSGHELEKQVFKVVNRTFISEYNLPADGVITTAKDLATWNAKLHQGKILQSKTYKLMTASSVLSQHDVFGEEKMGYGYGIRIVEDKGITYFGHTGLGDGFASLNIYVPRKDISIIVLENVMADSSDLYYYFEKGIKDLVIHNFAN